MTLHETTNDYTQRRLDLVSEMNTAVESLGKILDAMPGSPWGVKIRCMIIELGEMIARTDSDLNRSGVANCMNCNARTAPVNLRAVAKFSGQFCMACVDHYIALRHHIDAANALHRS